MLNNMDKLSDTVASLIKEPESDELYRKSTMITHMDQMANLIPRQDRVQTLLLGDSYFERLLTQDFLHEYGFKYREDIAILAVRGDTIAHLKWRLSCGILDNQLLFPNLKNVYIFAGLNDIEEPEDDIVMNLTQIMVRVLYHFRRVLMHNTKISILELPYYPGCDACKIQRINSVILDISLSLNSIQCLSVWDEISLRVLSSQGDRYFVSDQSVMPYLNQKGYEIFLANLRLHGICLYEDETHPMSYAAWLELSNVRGFNNMNGKTYDEYYEMWRKRYDNYIALETLPDG